VAKLFAKHIKMKESIELCRKKRMTMGVGTPQRLLDLLKDGKVTKHGSAAESDGALGALSTENLQWIVVDASHIDQKKRGIIELKDVHGPLVKLLNLDILKERYDQAQGGLRLIFF